MPSRVSHVIRPPAALLAAGILAACGRVISPPPPSSPPAASQEATVPGAPITIAGRAARVLQDYGFVTKRFSSDSTWGWRGNDRIAARLRYTLPSRDSTRVLLELWGACADSRTCMRGDIATIFARLTAEDAPPP
jgi:hypothetical protein